MKNKITAAFLLLFGITSFAQIDMSDSTAQAISYWDKNDKYEYTVVNEKIKLVDADTILKEATTMDVEIKVLKSTPTSYTVQWLFKDIQNNSLNADMRKFASATKSLKMIYMTDELGAVQEIINWKDIQKHMKSAHAKLKKSVKMTPEMDRMLRQLEATYADQEMIETFYVKEINQFHTFHGAKYTLGEVLEVEGQLPNLYGGAPLDMEVSVSLIEIDLEDDNYVLQTTQVVNIEQLKDAIFTYLNQVAKEKNSPAPKREDLNKLKNEASIISRIHDTGWVIASKRETIVISDNFTNIETCTIEMK